MNTIQVMQESIERLAKRIRALERGEASTTLLPGSGAPADAYYVVTAMSPFLSNEVLLTPSSGISIAVGTATIAVDATVVRTTRTISTTAPLSGGGTLAGDLTLSISPGTAGQLLSTSGALATVWKSFDWDDVSAAVGADMVHDHSSAAEGGTLPAALPAAHNILSAYHGDTTPAAVSRGDLMIGLGVVAKWERYGLVVPGVNIFNYLGVTNGEVEPTWKSASSNPGAAASILQSNGNGRLRLEGLGIGVGAGASVPINILGTIDTGSFSILLKNDSVAVNGTTGVFSQFTLSSDANNLNLLCYGSNSGGTTFGANNAGLGGFISPVGGALTSIIFGCKTDIPVIFGQNNTFRLAIGSGSYAGNIGVATMTPSAILSIAGNTARTISMDRMTATNTSGRNLTINAGGACFNMVSTIGIGAGGAGYNVGDVLTLATPLGGVAATVTVTSATGGSVDGVSLTTKGSYYSTGIKTTTVAPAGGTGCTINVLTLESATNAVGGNLILQSGIATGTQTSNILFQTPTPGIAGATDNAQATRATITYVGLGVGVTPTARLHAVGDADIVQFLVTGYTTQAVGTAMAQLNRNDTVAGISSILGLTALGSGAANDGGAIDMYGKSSTTAAQAMARIAFAWSTATHASRTSYLTINLVNNAGALTEYFRFIPTGLTVNPGDFTITTVAGKTIVLSPTVYNDIQFPVSAGKVPASHAPTWEAFTANTFEFSFTVDDYIDLQANELPHWWKEGTNGDIHLHLTNKTLQNTGANRYAKFSVWVAYADLNEVWVEQAVMSAEWTIANNTAALTHKYLDIGDATLTNYLMGAQVKVRIKRIAATGGTEYADNIFITQCGMHLQEDTIGSRAETTK